MRRSSAPDDKTSSYCLRTVSVTPRSSRNEVNVQPDGSIAVRVTAPPTDSAANRAVVKALSDALSIGRNRITIVRGAMYRQKLVQFDIPEEEFERRLKS